MAMQHPKFFPKFLLDNAVLQSPMLNCTMQIGLFSVDLLQNGLYLRF